MSLLLDCLPPPLRYSGVGPDDPNPVWQVNSNLSLLSGSFGTDRAPYLWDHDMKKCLAN